MMYSELSNASYYGNGNYQALEMDYAGGNLSMLIVLPNQTSLSQIETGLSSTEINSIRSRLVKQQVDVWLPRFNITKFEDMRDLLESLGIQDAFNPSAANFSGIGSGGLSISDVYHKAYIQVNESGTTAAAATG
ncbi:MAG: serpin family protein, partial [Candidatus Micrarchaeota archaeon]|nr:serpin family protein [Candidatus Micrarchaeota archaeon]